MSDEIRTQDDPLLRALLDSAALDTPREGAEDALLAALGVGATTTVVAASKLGATHAGASALANAAPLVAKLLGVLGVVGLGAVAWSHYAPPSSSAPRMRESERPLRSNRDSRSEPVSQEQDVAPAFLAPVIPTPPALPRVESAATPRSVPFAPVRPTDRSASARGLDDAAPGSSLEIETRLLGAARKALSVGDKTSAREHLRQYEREVPHGALQREADILWDRAR